MKIEIDINKIVEELNVKKLVEEEIMSNILESSEFEDIVEETLDNGEARGIISKKIIDIISGYLSSDEGKKCIIEKFEDAIVNSDVLTDETIVDLLAEFLKKSLMERSPNIKKTTI